MKLINVDNLVETNKTFSGNAGAKIGVIFNNDEYIVKYPKNIKNMNKVEISYSTSPLSEYIGSHIYEILGYPVHETLLGYDNDKLVVLCKNFNIKNNFTEFKNVANRLRSKEIDEIEYTDGSSTDIEKIMLTINSSNLISKKNETIKRFWDMFVVDYLINNNDRNNTNWGFMIDPYNPMTKATLSPIYDCGNSFNNKLSDKQLMDKMIDEKIFKEVTVNGLSSCFELRGHHVKFTNAFYNDDLLNLGLKDAILRNVPNIKNHFDEIIDFIENIPETENDLKICSPIYKDFIELSLKERLEEVLLPTYEELLDQTQTTKKMTKKKWASFPIFFSFNL